MGVNGGPDIVTDGLVFYEDAANSQSYPGSGTAVTDLINSNVSGSLNNSPVFSTDNGGQWSFSGTDDNVETHIPISLTDFTLDIWFYPIYEGGGLKAAYGMYAYANTGYNGFIWYYQPSFSSPNYNVNHTIYWSNTSNATAAFTNTTVYRANKWHNMVLRRELNTSVKTYIDGVENGSKTVEDDGVLSNTIQAQPLRFGLAYNNYSTSGKLSNYKLYNRALSESEIQQNYEALYDRFNIDNYYSDRRLKRNIVFRTYSKSGIPIYEFEYINKSNGEGRYVGTMAQDLIKLGREDAVLMSEDKSYYLVDYSKIDINFYKK
jgi:hypothetical protein